MELDELGAPDEHHLGARRYRLDRMLAVGCRVADVFLARHRDGREAGAQRRDDGGGVVQRQGRLCHIGEVAGVFHLDPVDIGDVLDQDDAAFRQLPHGADDFRMAGMADQDDLTALLEMAFGLDMDLADERACRIEIEHLAPFGLRRDRLGHAMGGEDHRHVVRDLVQFIDEDGALGFQAFDHEAVMDDFVADIDGGAVLLQGDFDDLDRAVHPGTEATGLASRIVRGRLDIVQPCTDTRYGLDGEAGLCRPDALL